MRETSKGFKQKCCREPRFCKERVRVQERRMSKWRIGELSNLDSPYHLLCCLVISSQPSHCIRTGKEQTHYEGESLHIGCKTEKSCARWRSMSAFGGRHDRQQQQLHGRPRFRFSSCLPAVIPRYYSRDYPRVPHYAHSHSMYHRQEHYSLPVCHNHMPS